MERVRVRRPQYALYGDRRMRCMTAVARVVCRPSSNEFIAEKDVHKHRKNAKFSFTRG